jgi:hypothetical protein
MSEKEQIIKEKVENTGVFDFKGFYSFANSWLKNESYSVVEEKYGEKVSGNAKDIYFEWKASKGYSDYFKLEIGAKFIITGLTEVEIDADGKKSKSNKGYISIELKGTLIRDPESKWDSTPSWRFMRDLYNKYIIPKRIDDTRDKLVGDIKTFKEEMKSFLEISGRS